MARLAGFQYLSPAPFSPREHRTNEVSRMVDAGDEHAGKVETDEHHSQVGGKFVDIFDPLHAPKGIARHHDACYGRCREHHQEGHHHRAANIQSLTYLHSLQQLMRE
jgi:hypothetical protein